ncbi:Bug family tripartite tricarboxylate transporter substrate binding protein [Achromobacter aloeverae]|uniref:Tripartite tricarboxylate transporter substrate binding protein n=1 Tax=Achromobacter aloeverae TaxID=1750518 RepID=A0A4Q1HH84_9BURK|nr:tripartite tricarboxylate transporter substrate binding protein [Achromobacter aloeverae]RXN86892.1 tripartite tricarboxylate transporter substrate binding protein [Achromobacter aloeverae]
MKTMRTMQACRKHLVLLALCGAAAALPLAATAQQGWPDHPIRIIVPFPPGNSSDVSMRLVAEQLSGSLRQTVLVENRTGAGGAIGTAYAAKAPADGYTLAMGSTGPMSIGQWLHPGTLGYDPAKDFVPVGAVAWAPQVLVVRKSFPASTFQEMLAYAKRPGVHLKYGSSGVGTTPHLVISAMLEQAGITATHIPYRGGVQTATDLVGGQVDFISDNVPVVAGLLAKDVVKPLGVSANTRIPSLPDVPTLQEQGLKDFNLQGWIILMAPAGTPQPIVDRLRAEMRKIIATPDVRTRLNGLGLVPMDMTTAQLGGFLSSESAKWRQLVKQSHAADN